MAKVRITSGNTKRVEVWTTRNGVITKVAVRNSGGQFHGATNFREHSQVGPAVTVPASPSLTVVPQAV